MDIVIERVNVSMWDSIAAPLLCGAAVQQALAAVLVPKLSVLRITIECLPAKRREGA